MIEFPFSVSKEALRRRQKLFNLNLNDVRKMWEFQKGRCALCGRPLTCPNIDHDHVSGEIRGLLCGGRWPPGCNRKLGLIDNPDFLERALAYVTNPPARTALGSPRFGRPGRIPKRRKSRKRVEGATIKV